MDPVGSREDGTVMVIGGDDEQGVALLDNSGMRDKETETVVPAMDWSKLYTTTLC
jgi:hypothetical protein